MATDSDYAATLEREFLPLRAKILEAAAALDRLDRARGDGEPDARQRRLREAISLLLEPTTSADRAERVQLHFSRSYDGDWRRALGAR